MELVSIEESIQRKRNHSLPCAPHSLDLQRLIQTWTQMARQNRGVVL